MWKLFIFFHFNFLAVWNVYSFPSLKLLFLKIWTFYWRPHILSRFVLLLSLNIFFAIIITGKGQNYENQNVKNQKELQKLRRRSERRNGKTFSTFWFRRSDQLKRPFRRSEIFGLSTCWSSTFRPPPIITNSLCRLTTHTLSLSLSLSLFLSLSLTHSLCRLNTHYFSLYLFHFSHLFFTSCLRVWLILFFIFSVSLSFTLFFPSLFLFFIFSVSLSFPFFFPSLFLFLYFLFHYFLHSF